LDLRRAIATNVVDPLGWKIKGTPVGAHLREFRRGQWDDRETFEQRRNARLAELLIHAAANVPFCRERVSGLTPEAIRSDPLGSLARFPILEKEHIRDNPDSLMCETGLRLVKKHTTGSTAMPLSFYRDTRSLAASSATTQLALEWAGAERGGRRLRLWPSSGGAPRPTRLQRLVDRIHDRVVLNTYLMTDDQIREYLRILNARPLNVLEGYPAGLMEIAWFAERHGLELPRPRAVVSGGSSLYDHWRELISAAYRAPVFDHYGSFEVGLVSSDCDRHRGMHVFGETTVLEVVDEVGKPVEPGGVGELIVTHLWQTSMPFIRYRMADRGSMSDEQCDCGRPHALLDRVVGRSGQSFTRADGTLAISDVFSLVITREFETPDLRKFQIVQEAHDHIVVRFVPEEGTEGIPSALHDGIRARYSEIMHGPCRVDFVAEDSIETAPGGKHLFAVSKVTVGMPEW
jgi:phenylacetate-CoA ligase